MESTAEVEKPGLVVETDLMVVNLLQDPDAHLTETERNKIVRIPHSTQHSLTDLLV